MSVSMCVAATVKCGLLLATVATVLACWRGSSAAARHSVWAAALVCVLAVPVMSFVLPRWPVLPLGLNPAQALQPTVGAPEAAAKNDEQASFVSSETGLPPLAPPAPALQPEPFQKSPHLASGSSEEEAVSPPLAAAGPVAAEHPPREFRAAAPREEPPGANRAESRPVVAEALLLVWILGAGLLLLRLLASHFGLWRLSRRSPQVNEGPLAEAVARVASSLAIRSSIRLHVSRERTIPMTWGFIQAHLLLPIDAEQWDVARLRAVLLHELAHVKRCDCRTQWIAQVACALHWLNPLVWFAAGRLALERERACDDVVLANGVAPGDYAEVLLDVATSAKRHAMGSLAVGMARPSRLEDRLTMVLQKKVNRGGVSVGVRAATIALLTALGIPIAIAAAGASSNPGATETGAAAKKRFAAEIGERVARALSRCDLAFVDAARRRQIRKDFERFTGELTWKDRSAKRRAAILDSIERNGPRMFMPRGASSESALNSTFLAFPDALRTLQWKLYRAAGQPSLSDAEKQQLAGQRQWMRTVIGELPERGERKRVMSLAQLEARFQDPLCIGFSRPLTAAQFTEFQARMRRGKLDLGNVVSRLLQNATGQLRLFSRDADLPFEDRVYRFGVHPDVTAAGAQLGFESNRRFRSRSRKLQDIEASKTIVDAATGQPLAAPKDVENEGEFRRWVELLKQGDFAYDDANGGALFAVRGARLLALDVQNWWRADAVPNDQLRRRLKTRGGRVVSLADYYQRFQRDPKTQSIYVGVLTREGRLAVVQVVGFDGASTIVYRQRPREMEITPRVERAKAADPPSAAAWSQPVDGLQFRLVAERTTFESWELPTFLLEVRNRGYKEVSAKKARSLFGDFHVKPGLLFLFKDQHKRSPNPNRWLVPRIHFDAEKLVGLRVGDSIGQKLTLQATREASSPRQAPYELAAGRYTVGIGKIGPRLKAELISNSVTLTMLPPGIKKAQQLNAFLKPYRINKHSLRAGFVPNKTELVWGEPMFANLIVQNLGAAPFHFGFGGDYRGRGRHDRFKVKVMKDGELMPDPSKGFDGGGILMQRTAFGHDIASVTVQLATYRTIPGPGEYTVSCRFDLTPSWARGGREAKFNVPILTTYKLKILPREPAHVRRVLDELFDRSYRTGGAPLARLIDVICSFGRRDAVRGLVKMAEDGDTEHRIAATVGLGRVKGDESLEALLKCNRDKRLTVRLAAIKALGAFANQKAVQPVIEALSDPKAVVRETAARALGNMKTDAAIEALTARVPTARPSVAAAILRALGDAKAPRVFDVVAGALGSEHSVVRRAALDAVSNYPVEQAAAALQPYAADTRADADFREAVVRKLAESLKQPIDPLWLVAVIKSRRGKRSLGDAPRLLRLYAGDRAAPTLLRCLDFDNPETRSYYNESIIDNQHTCRRGLVMPWNSDLNRDGKPAEIEQNRRTLRIVRAWLEYYDAHPWKEPPEPGRLDFRQGEQTWGATVDGLRIRAFVNRRVWHAQLPQMITIEAENDPAGSSAIFAGWPDPLEVEINGDWHRHDPSVPMKFSGRWRGQRYHGIQLSRHWLSISDKQPLQLKPGEYTARVRLSTRPAATRTGLVTSKAFRFRVIGN